MRSIGDHKSPIEAPPKVSGAEPKKPAMKRNESWNPMFGDKLDAIMQTTYEAQAPMKTVLRPYCSDRGPANNAPNPKPIRKSPMIV